VVVDWVTEKTYLDGEAALRNMRLDDSNLEGAVVGRAASSWGTTSWRDLLRDTLGGSEGEGGKASSNNCDAFHFDGWWEKVVLENDFFRSAYHGKFLPLRVVMCAWAPRKPVEIIDKLEGEFTNLSLGEGGFIFFEEDIIYLLFYNHPERRL
jgi:hypothetical protein